MGFLIQKFVDLCGIEKKIINEVIKPKISFIKGTFVNRAFT